MKAMILAAGRGTRMAPLTDHCPKPLLPLQGKTLIEHHIEKLARAGIVDIVINHAYLGHMIEQHLGNGERYGVRVQYSPESVALETGGGVLQALPLLGDEPFLLINGDVWTNWDYRQAFDVSLGAHFAHLWLVPNPEHHPVGDFCLRNEQVSNDDVPVDQRFTFSGISLIDPKLVANHRPGAFALAPLLRKACEQQRVVGSLLQADWVDVGTPQRLQQLEQDLQQGVLA